MTKAVAATFDDDFRHLCNHRNHINNDDDGSLDNDGMIQIFYFIIKKAIQFFLCIFVLNADAEFTSIDSVIWEFHVQASTLLPLISFW